MVGGGIKVCDGAEVAGALDLADGKAGPRICLKMGAFLAVNGDVLGPALAQSEEHGG